MNFQKGHMLFKKNKEKPKDKIRVLPKKRIIALGLLSISLTFTVFSMISFAKNNPAKSVLSNFDYKPNVESLGIYSNVEKFTVPNAVATVIFIPQIHKEPTTDALDSKNDQAVLVQKEILNLINSLVGQNNLRLIMDETDLYGPVPGDKISKIQKGMYLIPEYEKTSTELANEYVKSGGSKEMADQLLKSTKQKIVDFERRLYLVGAPAIVESENKNAIVYGSQNKATIEECRLRLRDIVKIEKKLASFEAKQNSAVSMSNNSDLIQSLKNLSGNKSAGAFSEIKNSQQEFPQLGTRIEDFEKISSEIDKLNDFETEPTNAGLESFSDYRPVGDITNLNQNELKKLYDKQYDEFMVIAKDRRSEEVSDNAIKMMEDNNQSAAILVFGAQHKDQIITELNNKNVNVVVITPDSIKNS